MFTFSLLPQDLWSSILRHVRPGESIELLKATKSLRSLILNQGPFQKGAERLKIFLMEHWALDDDSEDDPSLRYQIAIRLIYDYEDHGMDASFSFSLLNIGHIMSSHGPPYIRDESGWLLVRLIRSCRLLELRMRSASTTAMPEWQKFFDRWRFLPQIRQIADLTLTGWAQAHHWLPVLDHFEPIVTNSISFHLSDPQPEKERRSLDGLLEKANFVLAKSLQARMFKMCWEEDFRLDEYWRLFSQNHTADTVIFTHDSFDYFLETLDRFLKDGLPSGPKITSAALIASIRVNNSTPKPNLGYFEDMMERIDHLKPYHIASDVNLAPQMEEALTSKAKDDPALFAFYRKEWSYYDDLDWIPSRVPRNYDNKEFFELKRHGLFGMCTTERTIGKHQLVYENLQIWLQKAVAS